jgi:hypothetical protein
VHTRFNEESWIKTIAFAESLADPVWTGWKAQVVPLLSEALARGIHHHFQAGNRCSTSSFRRWITRDLMMNRA